MAVGDKLTPQFIEVAKAISRYVSLATILNTIAEYDGLAARTLVIRNATLISANE
jgi:hypothetical protein